MHTSCAPIARWTRAAATAESTPPLSAQITRPVPTWDRIAATCSSMIDAIVQFGSQPARRCRNCSSTCDPNGECTTSGWYCTPQMRRSGFSSTATGASAVLAVATKPSGTSVTASKWLIHTSCSAGMPSWSSVDVEPSMRVSLARPYSPRSPRPTVPPNCWAMSWAP